MIARNAEAKSALGVVCSLLLACAIACGSERPSATAAPRPNVLLVSLDSVRADRLGCYGASRPTSPAIDALAARGVLFENAMAPSSWTLPSHVSLLTGLSTAVHGVNGPKRRIDPARELLSQVLREAGYDTAGFVSAPYLHRDYGFDRGFARYENLQGADMQDIAAIESAHERSHLDQTAASVVDRALDWLAAPERVERPWFGFVHLWDVHYDYLPPPPYDEFFDEGYDGEIDGRNFLADPRIDAQMSDVDRAELWRLYDREVRAVDAQVGRLLESPALERPTIIALVSDHGDEFFEHGEKGHTRTLFEEVVRVPFILKLAGDAAAGSRIATPVSLEDVGPTLLSLAGVPPLREATGRDLSPLLRGEPFARDGVLLSFPPWAALRGESWKVIANTRTGAVRYYDLASDPAEQRPLQAPPELARALAERLRSDRAHVDAIDWNGEGDVELDPATAARLRELGYAE